MYDDELLREYEAPRALGAPARARRRRAVAAVVVVCLAFVGIGRWAQGALSSDANAIASNSFITGTVNVEAKNPVAVISAQRMAPGDSVFHVIKVVNNGSLQYRYAVVASSSDSDGKALQTQLWISAYLVPTLSACSTAGVASLSPLGPVRPVVARLPQTQPLFGDPARGQQSGDQVMAVVDTELLCVEAHLPASTGNNFGDAATALHLRFVAEQTAGNA